MPKQIADCTNLCLHTITTKPWSLEQAIDYYQKAGIGGVTVWRSHLEPYGAREAGRMLRESDLEVVSYCRGGFFPAETDAARRQAIDENRRIIDEAAEIGAPLIVLVCGAVPGQPLEESRKQIADGIEAVLPHAEAQNVRLSIEPLHPMFADTRSAINTLKQANDISERIDSDYLGVTVDVYHLWWDPDLEREIRRAGDKVLSFHVSDWRSPTRDLLNDRGLMGEGCIDVRGIRDWVESVGFDGFNEVEIFSNEYWAMDQEEFLRMIVRAYFERV